jgi:hypothetical protein
MKYMNATLEKFGLTGCVAFVTAMFLTYFAGMNTMIPHIAIAAFTALSIAMILGQYKDSMEA